MNLPPIYPASDFIDELRFHAEYRWDSQRIDLRLIHYHGLGGRAVSVAEPIVMRPYEPTGSYQPPALALTKESAQCLMDQLWNCGLRPTEGSGSAGALAATQRHLDDMRKIVFDLLDINEKQTPAPSG